MEREHFNYKFVGQLALLGVLLLGAYKMQDILDAYAMATFHPSAEVASITNRLQLTAQAKAILARAQPKVDDKAAFNIDCQTSTGELELGCYTKGRIYILRIENADLSPEMDVVLAHELLHAAYDRLGAGKKPGLDTQLEQAYAQTPDPELRTRMADYAKSEPGQQDNELHSILGTEYAQLPMPLEDHYRSYFLNRASVVAAQQRYQNVFSSRRQQLDNELAAIRALKSQLSILNRRMEGLKANGSIESYNALVPQQNQLVDSINRRIGEYQKAVDEYNALSKSLDSQQITTPAESTVQ